MKKSLPILLLLVFASFAAAAPPKAREESIFLFENRKLTIAVPAGFECITGKDENGMINLKLSDRRDKISCEIKFMPDPEGQFVNARARKELMNDIFSTYVSSSSEKAMQFEELEPRTGAGTYCVFTDSSVAGKMPLPPGEFLHLTAGLKAWPGVVVVFRLFSNETTSADYQALMKLLRDGVEERAVPLR